MEHQAAQDAACRIAWQVQPERHLLQREHPPSVERLLLEQREHRPWVQPERLSVLLSRPEQEPGFYFQQVRPYKPPS